MSKIGYFSKLITKDISNGAARAMLYGVNFKKKDFDKNIVGIGSMYYELNPCNRHLGKLQNLVKKNSINSMKTFNFNTIGVSDGITNGNSGMKYSLPSRELITDSIETMINAHHLDGFILIPGCDKNLPASMMAMGRINRPSILLYGGTILPGNYKGKDVDIVDAFESYGKLINDNISHADREELLKVCCHKDGGSCSGMYTCNTMATISEVMGLSLPYSSSSPANSNEKKNESKIITQYLDNLIKNNITPRDIVKKESFINAIKLTTILGGSTNSVIHLLAIAKEFEIDLKLNEFNEINSNLPILGNLKPHGKYSMYDIHKMGGLPIILKYLIKNDIIYGDLLTVSGKTINENLLEVPDIEFDQDVIYNINKPFKKDAHIKILFGNLSPKGSVAKISSNKKYFKGTAQVFENEDDMINALKNHKIKENTAIIIRNQGPKGGPGMPEMLKPSSALVGYGLNNVALITDGRWSGGSCGFLIGHIAPEAFDNGPISNVKNGDIIEIDLDKSTLNNLNYNSNFKEYGSHDLLKYTSLEISNKYLYSDIGGYLKKYRKLVGDASTGCTT